MVAALSTSSPTDPALTAFFPFPDLSLCRQRLQACPGPWPAACRPGGGTRSPPPRRPVPSRALGRWREPRGRDRPRGPSSSARANPGFGGSASAGPPAGAEKVRLTLGQSRPDSGQHRPGPPSGVSPVTRGRQGPEPGSTNTSNSTRRSGGGPFPAARRLPDLRGAALRPPRRPSPARFPACPAQEGPESTITNPRRPCPRPCRARRCLGSPSPGPSALTGRGPPSPGPRPRAEGPARPRRPEAAAPAAAVVSVGGADGRLVAAAEDEAAADDGAGSPGPCCCRRRRRRLCPVSAASCPSGAAQGAGARAGEAGAGGSAEACAAPASRCLPPASGAPGPRDAPSPPPPPPGWAPRCQARRPDGARVPDAAPSRGGARGSPEGTIRIKFLPGMTQPPPPRGRARDGARVRVSQLPRPEPDGPRGGSSPPCLPPPAARAAFVVDGFVPASPPSEV